MSHRLGIQPSKPSETSCGSTARGNISILTDTDSGLSAISLKTKQETHILKTQSVSKQSRLGFPVSRLSTLASSNVSISKCQLGSRSWDAPSQTQHEETLIKSKQRLSSISSVLTLCFRTFSCMAWIICNAFMISFLSGDCVVAVVIVAHASDVVEGWSASITANSILILEIGMIVVVNASVAAVRIVNAIAVEVFEDDPSIAVDSVCFFVGTDWASAFISVGCAVGSFDIVSSFMRLLLVRLYCSLHYCWFF
ncbi:hypothetical protein AKJ16_DCAP24147 [Drosera capensis]